MSEDLQGISVVSVIPSLHAGGVATVCHYTAQELSRRNPWKVTLVSLHDQACDYEDRSSGLRTVCLGLTQNCARQFLEWLRAERPDLLITSDVASIEAAFPYIPAHTRHIIQVHDSSRRYSDVAVRNAASANAVTCVGFHMEEPLRRTLLTRDFRGIIRTIHNGANYPPAITREVHSGPLRLLYIGDVAPLKGVMDFVPLLTHLQKMNVNVTLNIVGGSNELLQRKIEQNGLAKQVIWSGVVPHRRCYEIAMRSDLLLVPSRKEAFGMATVEAMSMGCVPMAYDFPSGSTEIIEHGVSGILLPVGRTLAWAREIRDLNSNRERLHRLALGAERRARMDFSSATMAKNMKSLILEVLRSDGECPPVRRAGLPPISHSSELKRKGLYRLLPLNLRNLIRHLICSNARLSVWLLNR